MFRFPWLPNATASTVAAIALALPAPMLGVPITYSYVPTGGTAEGSGVFTLDIGEAFGSYHATDVAGGGSVFGDWTSVTLFVDPTELVLEVTADVTFVRSAFPASYGLSAFSTASEAWELVVTNPMDGFADVIITAVPEPSAAALLLLGLVGIGSAGRRRRPLAELAAGRPRGLATEPRIRVAEAARPNPR